VKPSVRISCIVAALAAFLAGCGHNAAKKRDPSLATAFVGPVELNIRSEIQPKSAPVAAVKHGEKVDVLQIRRRFVRVRTASDKEGWTEVRNLLGPEQMDALEEQSKRARDLPSQGEATVYSPLNIHTEPSRTSTSFYRITEGIRVDVVGHQWVPKTNAPQSPPFQIAKKTPPPRKKKPKKEPAIPPIPKPAAPALPSNWRELSKTDLPEPPSDKMVANKQKEPKPVPMEDWSFVRTKNGRAGWALTRNLVMAIPDEVAQYSEGARITSYHALADVQDGDQTKHHWLWTTTRDSGLGADFESFRVFIYMLRRHRYETAYIERRVEGFYPVTVTRGAVPKFSLIVRNDEGDLVRRTYQLDGYQVRKIGEQPWNMQPGTPGATTEGNAPKEQDDDKDDVTSGDTSLKTSLLERIKGLFGRK
jgi:hypothetical protein